MFLLFCFFPNFKNKTANFIYTRITSYIYAVMLFSVCNGILFVTLLIN